MAAGRLVLMGSGETAPTMVATHRRALEAAGADRVVILDGPFGFQENASLLVARLAEFFRTSLGVDVETPPLRRPDAPEIDKARVETALRRARAVFAGPGSPTYALRVWRSTGIREALIDMVARGGSVILASAAALTVGRMTLPVYEIYKVGEDPHWVPGLDVAGGLGLPMTVIPHWNNAEGGNHDTSRCYVGERRLRSIQGQLDTGILGIDEHTAVVVDFGRGEVEVTGLGRLTVRSGSGDHTWPAGSVVPIETIREALGAGPGPTEQASSEPPGGEGRLEEALEAAVEAVSDETGRRHLRRLIVEMGEASSRADEADRRLAAVVDLVLEMRQRARREGRFAEADAIRGRLGELGIEVRDTPEGWEWRRLEV